MKKKEKKMVTIYKIYKDNKWRIRTRVPETSKILKGQHSDRYGVWVIDKEGRKQNKEREGNWIIGVLVLIGLLALLMFIK